MTNILISVCSCNAVGGIDPGLYQQLAGEIWVISHSYLILFQQCFEGFDSCSSSRSDYNVDLGVIEVPCNLLQC